MTLNRKQVRDLRVIKSCPQNLRKQLLKTLAPDTIKAICECSLNVLNGNIPLSTQQKKQLTKYKSTLRKIAGKRGALYTKKKLIIQRGGFLNILIPAAITAISSLFSRNGI